MPELMKQFDEGRQKTGELISHCGHCETLIRSVRSQFFISPK